MVSGALNRIKKMWRSNEKNVKPAAGSTGVADGRASAAKKQGKEKKGKKKAQRTAAVKPE